MLFLAIWLGVLSICIWRVVKESKRQNPPPRIEPSYSTLAENKEIKALLLELIEERKDGFMTGDIRQGRFTIRESKSGGIFIKENDQSLRRIHKHANKVLRQAQELSTLADELNKILNQAPPRSSERTDKPLVLSGKTIPPDADADSVIRTALKHASTKEDKEIIYEIAAGVDEEVVNNWLADLNSLPDWVRTHKDAELFFIAGKVFGTTNLPAAFYNNLGLYRTVGREISKTQEKKYPIVMPPKGRHKYH